MNDRNGKYYSNWWTMLSDYVTNLLESIVKETCQLEDHYPPGAAKTNDIARSCPTPVFRTPRVIRPSRHNWGEGAQACLVLASSPEHKFYFISN